MEEGDVIFMKVNGDVLFEGKVSSDVKPHELERGLGGIYIKSASEKVKSFKGLQNNVELVAGSGVSKDFAGVLYVGADDVLRKSKRVPSCECVMMTLRELSHEECEKVFKCL